MSRGVVAVSTVVVLGLTAACSGSGGDGKGDGDGAGGGKPSKSAEAGTSSVTAKLEKVALASGDVKKYKVEVTKGSEKSAGSEKSGGEATPPAGRVNPAECRPLSEMLTAAAPATSKAHVSRTLSPTDVADTTTTEVVLLAYGQADAEKAMDTLRTATKSKKCATFRDGGRRYIGVRPQPAPVGGDEAVSYKLASRSGEFLDRDRVTVVRSGSTVIAFRASNVFDPESAKTDEEGEAAGLPEKFRDGVTADPKVADAIVDAQLAKLAEAKAK
ncbi:hypothetical protein GCM10010449_34890 [Streptomyces rectiviolaceus]|uniref:Lipoprotein n=1 Tax=Streptomyces rectiviolaceus TaxID=332591 RepID=A0ABP6MFH6_9ACTN